MIPDGLVRIHMHSFSPIDRITATGVRLQSGYNAYRDSITFRSYMRVRVVIVRQNAV